MRSDYAHNLEKTHDLMPTTWTGARTLAVVMGLAPSTVRRHLQDLKHLGRVEHNGCAGWRSQWRKKAATQ